MENQSENPGVGHINILMLMGLPEDIVLDEEGISRGFEDKVLHKRLRRVVISLGRDIISLQDEKGNSRLCTRVN